MALTRRGQRMNQAIWPGFVDAMTGLLLVLMFVLTIFMVIQFVLRETITGQASQLDELAEEVSALASALGLEQDRSADLSANLADATDTANQQAALIATLTRERDDTQAALVAAQNQITGFEAQVAGLLADRTEAQAQIADLEGREASLLSEQEALNLALATARDEIDASVEAARLAAARREALEAMISDLENTGEVSAARIAALEEAATNDAAQISDLEAARLADAAAAEALRERLANADTELTAMTLALEEKRREAEETLTLLAATQAARDQLDMNLAAALLAQQNAENELTQALVEGSNLDARLLAALGLAENTAAELAEARAALEAANAQTDDLTVRLAAAVSAGAATADELSAAQTALEEALAGSAATEAEIQAQLAAAILAQEAATATATDAATLNATLEAQLAEALLAQEALQAEVASLSDGRSQTEQDRADLQARLAAALAQAQDLEGTADERAALLATANRALSEEQALSAESQRQVALLNAQVAELRNQVGTLQSLLNIAEEADADANVQIEQLGAQLNTALARVAAEERRRRALEEAERARLEEERARLEAEAQNLERFRSDFFGELRSILEGQDGVQVVGDRFVFSSEVLFRPGEAELSFQGRGEIAKVADILKTIADDIPAGIDWVIRVDGHTDNIPLSGTGQYRDNWELSQARALSVVRYMQGALGIPPQRLAANGFGEYQPLNTADTDAARAQNRRIELKLTER
ncbi:peptidoglycan -binding protein [Yoonia sp. R2331]|uniref:peptidoglycan -binding protein n=1 Tax=Yoonia sp. R2331 TaxID=3237238 RepID=UPI0034E3D7D7